MPSFVPINVGIRNSSESLFLLISTNKILSNQVSRHSLSTQEVYKRRPNYKLGTRKWLRAAAVCSESRINRIHISVPVIEINKYKKKILVECKKYKCRSSFRSMQKGKGNLYKVLLKTNLKKKKNSYKEDLNMPLQIHH